ncbi:MAG TPA: aldo/keto reductase [Opitutaceae bacterium]|nr:aldo/keto reductase [Opitutaceae bacterium]
MNYRTFGKLGWKTSEISFGAWAIGGGWGEQDDTESLRTLHRALDLGVTCIDTAAGYGNGRSERLISQVLKERKPSGDRIYVATKTPPAPGDWPPSPYDSWEERYSERYLRQNIEERLRSLGTDTIDLLQLHTWTRAWNRNPQPFALLRTLQKEGKIRAIGVSTPEHDQNSVIDLMRGGWVDSVQVIYNLFEQEPAAELLPVAQETGTAIIVRVAFDEGVLTGKFKEDTTFPDGDFRQRYFQGDRIRRAVQRAAAIEPDLVGTGLTLPEAALKFALAHPAVSTVIPGMRRVSQADANCSVSEKPNLTDVQLKRLQRHRWNRGLWYPGK